MAATRTSGGSGFNDVVLWAVAGAGAAAGAAWTGAELASLVVHRRAFPVSVAEVVAALGRLPSSASRPALAWPPHVQALLPGPVLYWLCTAVTSCLFVAAAVGIWRLFARPGVGTEPRRPLGVDTRAHLARPRDVAPLVVSGPEPGRLILGTVGNKLVATEKGDQSPRRWRSDRHGDRSAVAIIGPSRCGKTANAISGILEWDGPAVLSSVKDDLLRATLSRRKELGDVKVFDPTASTGHGSAGWSPLRGAGSATGAQKAARALAATVPKGERPDVEFFTDLAVQLLWPLFFTATVAEKGMIDVLGWVLNRDQPRKAWRGHVAAILDAEVASSDPARQDDAVLALASLQSVWANDERTTSCIYVTAQRMLAAWQDPGVAASAQACDIDLNWLMAGKNTLYLCSPLHEQSRLATLFAGLLSDLVEQQAYEWVAKNKRPLPDLLVVLDEAANTPTRWLPNVASTCSGLGILLVTIWQSKAQIDAAYGIQADSVLTNHGTKVIFSGVSDPSTSEYASRLVGEEEVRQRGSSTDEGNGRHSVSESTTRLRLLPGDVLRQAAPFQALLVHGTLPPAHLHARPYHLNRRLRRLSGRPRRRLPTTESPSQTRPG